MSEQVLPTSPRLPCRRRIIAPVSLLGLACFLLFVPACKRSTSDAGRSKRPPPQVVVEAAIQRDIPLEVAAPVDLRPLEQVDVGSKVLGYLDAVLVDRGDKVRRGQPIALVRPSDLPDQLAAAKSSFAQVVSTARLAKTNFDRAAKLQPAGVLSEQELEQSRAAVVAAEAAEAASKSQLEALAVRLGETQITSPIDGYVAARRLDPGALVGPSTGSSTVLTIMRTDRLRAYMNIVERDALSVAVGMPARILLDAHSGEQFLGAVVRISPAVDPNTRTLEAEVQIPNRDGRIKPGMYGRGFIQIGRHDKAVLVPVNAISFGGTRPHLFVVTNDTARKRSITVGTEVDDGAFLEVKDGVASGELVVVAGTDGLVDGAKVRVFDKRKQPSVEGPKAGTTKPVVPLPSASAAKAAHL